MALKYNGTTIGKIVIKQGENKFNLQIRQGNCLAVIINVRKATEEELMKYPKGKYVHTLYSFFSAAKYGCEVRKVNRFYPSSRTCSVCQYVNEHLSLRDRSWTCPECGTHHDRDANATINILRQGIASSGSPRKTKVRLRKVR